MIQAREATLRSLMPSSSAVSGSAEEARIEEPHGVARNAQKKTATRTAVTTIAHTRASGTPAPRTCHTSAPHGSRVSRKSDPIRRVSSLTSTTSTPIVRIVRAR